MNKFKINNSKIFSNLKLLVLIVVLGFGINYASAIFVNPTANPPADNAPAPLNISSNPQSKGGAVLPGSMLNVFGFLTGDDVVGFNSINGRYLSSSVTGIPSTDYPLVLCTDDLGKVITCPAGSGSNNNTGNVIFDVPGDYIFYLPDGVNIIKSFKLWGGAGSAGASFGYGSGSSTGFLFGGSGASGCYIEATNYAVAPNQHSFEVHVGAPGAYNGGTQGDQSWIKKAGFSATLYRAGGGYTGGGASGTTPGIGGGLMPGQGGPCTASTSGFTPIGQMGRDGIDMPSPIIGSQFTVINGGKGYQNYANGGDVGLDGQVKQKGDPGRIEISW